jgi:hypothetical protein
MLRRFYRWLLRFHPTRFRERFAEETLSIFDQAKGRAAAAELVADAFISLVRQWTMRSEYWEEKAGQVSNRTAGSAMDIRTVSKRRGPGEGEVELQRSCQRYKTSVSGIQAIPRIQPSISATLRSGSVRLGPKNRPRLPSWSLLRSHSAAA